MTSLGWFELALLVMFLSVVVGYFYEIRRQRKVMERLNNTRHQLIHEILKAVDLHLAKKAVEEAEAELARRENTL